MADLSKIVEDLSSLTVLEAAELAKLLEEAGHTPREILKDIEHLLTGRKNLAHEFLLSYVLEKTAGAANRAEKISILEAAEQDFLQWRDFVDALNKAVAEERGVPSEAANWKSGTVNAILTESALSAGVSLHGHHSREPLGSERLEAMTFPLW